MKKSKIHRSISAEIINAASHLFSEKGYKATSIKEIADKVGLHKTSLFHYFKNKEEILMRVMDESLKDHINNLKEVLNEPNLSAEEKLKLALENQVSVTCRYKDHINVYLSEIKSLLPENRKKYNKTRKQYETYFEEIIRQVQNDKKSDLFKGLDPSIVKLGILGMCNWIIKWYDKSGRSTPNEIYGTFYSMITRKPFDNSKEDTVPQKGRHRI